MDPLAAAAAAAAATAAAGPPPPPLLGVLGGALVGGAAVGGGGAPAAGDPPPFPPLPPPPAKPSWQDLVLEANLQPHEVPHSLSITHKDTTWEAALRPFVDGNLLPVPMMANMRTAYLRAFMDAHALSTSYFLMAEGNNVGVATGIFPCPFLPSLGSHAFWIWNDYTRHPTGQTIPPKMYKADGNLEQSSSLKPSIMWWFLQCRLIILWQHMMDKLT